MERKIKSLGIALGAVIALGVAMSPLTSYAEADTDSGTADSQYDNVGGAKMQGQDSDSRKGQVIVSVSSSISLEVFVTKDNENTNAGDKSQEMRLRLEPNMTTTGTFAAVVKTNKAYTISLSAGEEGPDLKQQSGSAVIYGNGKVGVANESGWGVKRSDPGISDSWHALPTGLSTDAVFFTGTAPNSNEGVTTNFTVGVSIANDIPQGTYQGSIIVTAANT